MLCAIEITGTPTHEDVQDLPGIDKISHTRFAEAMHLARECKAYPPEQVMDLIPNCRVPDPGDHVRARFLERARKFLSTILVFNALKRATARTLLEGNTWDFNGAGASPLPAPPSQVALPQVAPLQQLLPNGQEPHQQPRTTGFKAPRKKARTGVGMKAPPSPHTTYQRASE